MPRIVKKRKARKLLMAAKTATPVVAGVLMLTGCNPATGLDSSVMPRDADVPVDVSVTDMLPSGDSALM